MIDILKKTLLAGLGATIVTKENLEKRLEELVQKGKISAEEARETAEKVAADSKKEYESARTEIGKAVDQAMEKVNVATHKDIEILRERLATLEAKVQILEQKPE